MDQQTLDSAIHIPLTRANYYPHESEVGDDGQGGIVELAVDRVGVDHDVVENGRVTLFARGSDPLDGYGFGFDMTPDAARHLAGLLERAAAAAESYRKAEAARP